MTQPRSVVPPRRTRRLVVAGLVGSWFVSLLARSPWFEASFGTLARGAVTILALLALGWFAVRNYRAAQAIGDDVDGHLDERQLALRNRTYLDAYRLVGAVVVSWSCYLSIASDSPRFWFPSSPYTWLVIFEGTLVMAVLTPSILLTWREADPSTGDES